MNISLDSLETEAFATCVGKTGQLESVLDGIRSAINANFKSVKINTVLSRYWSDDEVKSLLQYVEKWPVVWRFIEYMPFQGDAFHGPTFDEWKEQLERVSGGSLTEVHSVYGFGPATYLALPSGKAVGFIFLCLIVIVIHAIVCALHLMVKCDCACCEMMRLILYRSCAMVPQKRL